MTGSDDDKPAGDVSSEREKPVLSIIIVSYNTRTMTIECLTSVFEGSKRLPIEVIVVDNDSQDDSVASIEAHFPDLKVVRNSRNFGFAAANNQGFEVAQGEFVLLLNSDTIVLGDVLQESVRYLQENLDVGAMGCRVLNTDRTVQKTCSGYPTVLRLVITTLGLDRLSNGAFDHYLLRHWERDEERDVEVISGCYLLTRRETLSQVGWLDESFFFFGEETDWCFRARRMGWTLRFAPVGEIIHHGGGSVRKLNHDRDVMLTNALIHLHRKNYGSLSGFFAYLTLATFNASRFLYWMFLAIFRPGHRGRATHFRRVLASTLFPKPGK